MRVHIHHGWDVSTPYLIAKNRTLIESRPWNGVTVNLPGISDMVLSSTPVTRAACDTALKPMPVMKHCWRNFAMAYCRHAIDWYSDAQWKTICTNFANLAAALAAKGQFDGIFFDVEKYGDFAYPWDNPGSVGGRADGYAKVNARGRQLADAICAAWPKARLLTTYGPWVGETKTVQAAYGNWASMGYNDTAWRNELMGVFAGGLEHGFAGHPDANYIDGGEVYQAQTQAQFATAYAWMKTGLAASKSPVVTNPDTYKASVAFGVYDRDIRNGYAVFTPAEFQRRLTNALKQANLYVWSYTEKYDWMNAGNPGLKVPQEYVDAMKAAMVAGGAVP